ncbi:hypothetical protein LZ30DRAFT_664841 [Colletotrichum cereale]|nr:hypothetical protein LZ30DRAFT_664841 [Colletotrichum cereale]
MGTYAHLYYLGLTAVGFDALWGVMVRNGTAQAIGQANITGVLPCGEALRRSYTGVAVVDRLLLSPVIFYDGMTHHRHPTQRALLVALFSTMQTTSFTMIVNGIRHSRHPLWPALESMFWGMFNQSHGAAFVYPVYFFTHLNQFTQLKHDHDLEHVDEADAEALVCTSVIAAILPLWLIVPTIVPCSTDTRQVLIASYRLTPAILSMMPSLLAGLLRITRRKNRSGTQVSRSRVKRLVKLSLVISGAAAAMGHLYGIASGCLASSSRLVDVFWPGATNVRPGAHDIITQGCHLFLQNDWWVIVAAVVPVASAMISNGKSDGTVSLGLGHQCLQSLFGGLKDRWVTLTGLTIMFSPGAALAWSLAETV